MASVANVISSDGFSGSDYISLNKNNINDFLGIKEPFLFNITCKSFLLFNNIKAYFTERSYRSYDDLQVKNIKPNNLEDIEKVIQESSNKENEHFFLEIRKLIERHKEDNLFILQIGLSSITQSIFKKIQNIIFIEENAEVCKYFFRNKYNRCWLYLNGVEIYCKIKESLPKDAENPLMETLNTILKVLQMRNFHLIDILIVNNKYSVALLYYLFPYTDPNTLVIILNRLNYKMKHAIFEYYDFLDEALFSKEEKKLLNENKMENKIQRGTKTLFNGKVIIEEKALPSFLCITILKPKMMLNPSADHYKSYITDDYNGALETELYLAIEEVEKMLKLQDNLYAKHKVVFSNYLYHLYLFDYYIYNKKLKRKIIFDLIEIVKVYKKEGILTEEDFQHVLKKLNENFKMMLFHVYEDSKFKQYFMPLIDILELYRNKEDPHCVILQFLIYELINDSYELASYELKEYLFLDMLKETSKTLNNMTVVEIIQVLTKLYITLKKIKSRESIIDIKELAQKEFHVHYENYEL